MASTISVVICTRNRRDDLARCLASLAQQTSAADQLIIIDSSDVPLTEQHEFVSLFTTHQYPHSELIYLHTRPGLTYQRNQGIARATKNLVFFFDDDVVLEPDYLAQMQRAFDERPEYAAGMGDITNLTKPSWKYQFFRTMFMLPRQRASGNFTWSGLPTHPYGTTQFKRIEVLGGCCMVFRRSILSTYAFDEHFQGYSYLEDADMGYRISRENKIFFNPLARLSHYESQASRDKQIKTSEMFVVNSYYLLKKNVYRKRAYVVVFYLWSLVGLLLESLLMRNRANYQGYKAGTVRLFIGVFGRANCLRF